ncbi:cell division protein FtsL [Melissococcus plutonius]|uniref:Cell division protein FtsL n=2 Tax=Melissococcus plutonius TaxID=33970 RepID=FTSL_MELPT|nr:cell division protein FtsL [Melissococcus plutonius]F3Y9Q5.1 RecName: Full=Cell division protein FtsL [Melissococcus plutonius ATCC 35311]BAL62386.1 cell division protein FtsL [Melissococcus plutonius DAT561]AIM24771.1 cell division protein FtsL [Melissococcus plutonius S1]KMT24883.1 cell division protein FtsL [Melissococcus plutonius]KMT26520.1 cell division protein FtsL [Melissococcus plutonius]KMT27770.1 cell division protein FtsL [Melissococcus plutonius]
MAELKKMRHNHYDVPVMDEPVIASQIKKTNQKKESFQLPQKKLNKISVFEKILCILLLCSIVGIVVITIQIRTTISETMNNITEAQVKNERKKEEMLKLEQEKSELSKADRIKSIGKKQGLSEIDGNLRKVK